VVVDQQSAIEINTTLAPVPSVFPSLCSPCPLWLNSLLPTYANLGAAQRTLGDEEAAHQSSQQALRLNPNQFNAWLGEALLARKAGRIDEAINDLSRSLEVQPTAQAYMELGRTAAQAGRTAAALDAYQEALKISPDFTEARQAAEALQRPKQ
jgi:tetratricopeptide (TPR) repeat protein